jgi:hypothetical protein
MPNTNINQYIDHPAKLRWPPVLKLGRAAGACGRSRLGVREVSAPEPEPCAAEDAPASFAVLLLSPTAATG